MDENTMRFNENQLKRTGFAEAFTPELEAQMEQGAPVIAHTFKKEYDGDQVEATLHLKKSLTSDHYFLNKFDLSLQKEGQEKTVSQTFYLTGKRKTDGEEEGKQKAKQDNKYTLKEGYNLLAGRPVFKNLVSNEGNEYQAWVKLNFTNKLENGNFEMKQYMHNYGFNLENTLSDYAIKELTNSQHKASLIDSLHRGNLQKATFLDKVGREEKLYVSPNITLGALNVYDQNKQRIPMEKLMEKEYINRELAEKISQFIKQQDQKQGQVQSQTPGLKQEPQLTQKQKKVQQQKNDMPVKKQAHKQKVH